MSLYYVSRKKLHILRKKEDVDLVKSLHTYLAAPLGDRRRCRARREVKAGLDEAGEVVLEGGRARLAVHAEGRDRARRLRDHELHLAERAARRGERAAHVTEEARARPVDGGGEARAVTRTTVANPRRRRKRVCRRVERKDLANQRGDGDVELIIRGNVTERLSRHYVYNPVLENISGWGEVFHFLLFR
jgi:hypothetical protein